MLNYNSIDSNCYVAHDVRNIMSSIDGADILICTAREARLQLKQVSPLLLKRKIPLWWNFFVNYKINSLFKYSKKAEQPSITSLYVSSKLPVYQGSFILRGLFV